MLERHGFIRSAYKKIPRKLITSVGASVGAGAIAVTSASVAESPIRPPSFDNSGNFIVRQVKEMPTEIATMEMIPTATPALETPTLSSTPEVVLTQTATPEPTIFSDEPIEQVVDWDELRGRFLGQIELSDFSPAVLGAIRTKQGIPLGEIVPSDSLSKKQVEIKEEVEFWWENESAVRIIIPKIGIDSELIQQKRVHIDGTEGNCDEQRGDHCTLETPDEGIATPDYPFKNKGENPGEFTNQFVYGHSKWLDDPKPFRKLTQLDIGDVVEIESRSGERAKFRVDRFVLIEYGAEGNALNEHTENILTLQTTESENGRLLLEEAELMEKAGSVPIGHYALQVICEPVE